MYLISQELHTQTQHIHSHCKRLRRERAAAQCLLQPLFDGVQRVDGHGVDHRHFLVVVFINDDHVEVLQVKLDSLEMNQLHLVERHHERRLREKRVVRTGVCGAV